MGGIQPKQLKEALGEGLSATPVMSKHVLESKFDPRSPTTDITRTPIQLDYTPQLLRDPRSPTEGILRTPIAYIGKPFQTI